MRQSSDTTPTTTQSLQTLRGRIEHEVPWLHIVRCIEQPYPFIEVKDTSNLNIHVSFSSEVEFQVYMQVVGKGGTA